MACIKMTHQFNGKVVDLVPSRDGSEIDLTLIERDTGDVFMQCSIRSRDLIQNNEHLHDNTVFIKDYSGNHGCYDFLRKEDVIKPFIRIVISGFAYIPECKVDDKVLDCLCAGKDPPVGAI